MPAVLGYEFERAGGVPRRDGRGDRDRGCGDRPCTRQAIALTLTPVLRGHQGGRPPAAPLALPSADPQQRSVGVARATRNTK